MSEIILMFNIKMIIELVLSKKIKNLSRYLINLNLIQMNNIMIIIINSIDLKKYLQKLKKNEKNTKN